MAEVIERIVTAVHWKYVGEANVQVTDVYFNDGTKLALDGHWELKVGESYRIEYTDGNPADIQSVTMKL